MSFGCSVGDVVLLSQVSLQIYRTLTTGRKNASRDLEELSDVLFGFRCALEHLRTVADDIYKNGATTDTVDFHGAEVRRKLDRMAQSFAKTLEELDSATSKYRQGIQHNETDQDASQDDTELTLRMRLKRCLTSNVMKVRWDIDKDIARVYRAKLQSHTDAINLVLNTIVWSSTHKARIENRDNTNLLSHIQESMASSNLELSRLMQDVLKAVSSRNNHQDAPALASAHLATQEAARNSAINKNASQSISSNTVLPDLPSHILSLNKKRLAYAPQVELILPKASGRVSNPPTASDQLESVTRLVDELNRVFDKTSSAHISPTYEVQLTQWTRKVDTLLDALLLDGAGTAIKQDQDLIEILVQLNNLIENADDDTIALFYQCSRTANIDAVLEKIPKVTRSVRAEKELEDFEDDREEWEKGHQITQNP